MKDDAVAALRLFDVGDRFSGPSERRRAAVLVPLLERDGRLHALMTLRAQELRTSAGEVCFPGGKRDPDDRDDVHTALREAEEEIGLRPEDVQVVCRLFPIISKSGLLVTPVVGFIEHFSPRPNPAEVSAVFTVPLDLFTREKDHVASPGGAGPLKTSHAFYFTDPQTGSRYHIWGLTAMFAMVVAAVAFRKKPEFDLGLDFEDFLAALLQWTSRTASKL